MKRLFTAENVLNLLFVFVPTALLLEHVVHAKPLYVFISSALAIIPIAGLMGKSTEHLAEHLGQGAGGLLSSTFGNAAELIIALTALRQGLYDVVKASITGSILGNLLLVFGLSAFLGGIRHSTQKFNRTAAGVGTTMLVLSVIALVIPAVFDKVAGVGAAAGERELSLEIAVVLIVTYVVSLFFTLRTHRHLYAGEEQEVGEIDEAMGTHGWSRGKAIVLLLGATALVALMSELLVGAIEETAKELGLTDVFVGVILLAIVGNAAENSTAILMARKNKMDLALHIAVGASTQIALFVAPVLVFMSYLMGGSGPMDLLFTTFEVVSVAIAVGVITLISQDGESHWMEGVQLLAVYLILGIAFYNLPV
jgi:Ca2+:H+ antiporter